MSFGFVHHPSCLLFMFFDGIIQKMSLVLIIVKLLCKVNRLDNVACWKMRKAFEYLSEYSRQVFSLI